MVNHKKKTSKRTKATSNTSRKEKRTTVPTTLASDSLDQDKIPVVTSLPPAVDGHLRCFLQVSVPTIHWIVHKHPTDVQVRLKWWGEDHGDGVLFRPIDDKASDQGRSATRLTSVRYAVCSGPRQFNAYLKDMGPLIFDVVHGPSLTLLGKARLANVSQLSASTPVQGFFDVMSTSSPEGKIAQLSIALRFESISAAYNQISSSIPTVDMEIDPRRRRVDESDIQPTPPPLSLNPATPIVHPRQTTQDTELFVSPAALTKGVTFAPNSPERLEYTAEHSLMWETADNKPKMDITEKQDNKGNTASLNMLSPGSQMKANRGTSTSSDLIAALLQRGEKLREAMVMSADEDNDLDEPSGLASVIESRNTPPGKLFKAILTSSETDYRPEVSGVDERAVTESVFLHNNKAVDLVLGEEHMHYMEESPMSSPESSIVSEPGDPLYDESLLKDLFYTTRAIQANTDSDSTVSTDDDDGDEHDQTVPHDHTSQEKNENKDKYRQHSLQIIPGKENVMKSKTEEYLDPTPTSTDDNTPNELKATVAVPGRHSPMNTSTESSLPSVRKDEASNPNPDEFIENLGPEKLTALGRVDAARVMVDNLRIKGDNMKAGTYFVEYSFPTSTSAHHQEDGIAMASELTRIASKRFQDGVVLFNHRSVFPVLFNSTVVDFWWRKPLTFRLYFRQSGQRMPAVIGEATFPLKAVLQSDSLSSSASLQIKHNLQSKHGRESSSSASVYRTSGSDDHPCTSEVCGPLLVKLELMADGKQLHIEPSISKKPPLPMTATPTKTADHIRVTKPAQSVGQVYDTTSYRTADAVKPSGKSLPQAADKLDVMTDKERDPLTLYTLLWVPEGSSLLEPGDRYSKGVSQGLVSNSNLYLVCRMFWCDEVSKSRVCWGTTNPPFGFKLVAPVMLNSSMLQRVCNNFMVTEVWNRIGPHESADKLLGLAKLPLHQLYLSYRDPKITRTLLKSKYPVVAVDDWMAVTNPFTRTQHGHLRVLLALGSEEQIATILALKCGGEVPVGLMPRPACHLDTARVRDDGGSDVATLLKNQELVEHQFDITVEDIRGLSVFGSTVWGETDCFVQYHFPFQRLQVSSETMSEEIPKLQPHRTPTTLCVPDPAFHDVARHAFKLPHGLPVQKHLLAAFTGSWVAAPSVPGSGGVPFELWRRYYYPNTRDQMVAKAILPIAKLCAMVTMQRQRQANIQTFSLPLTVLAGDEMDGMRQDRVQGTGLLDVTVKYQQVRLRQLMGEHAAQREEQNVVCLSLEVLQACGLKATARLHAKSKPALSYPAEVGVNAYIMIHFPLGKKRKHVTRTVARTFSPEFSYSADILLPVIVPSGVAGKGNLSLAEQLEDSEMIFEVWHQISRGMSGDQVIRSSSKALPAGNRDVLLGVGRVPLITLLTHKTGVKGWSPIYLPSNSDMHDATPHGSTEKVVGGLELSIHFCEAEDRDQVIHVSRGVGWSPLAGVECEESCLDEKEVFKETSWKFSLKINKAWIPPTEVHSFYSGVNSCVKAYARYKLHNKAPICSRMLPVKDGGDGKLICELKHSKDTMLPVSPSLIWCIREESLEIQLWVSNQRHNAESKSKKRDRLLGSAFVDVSSLLASHQRTHRQISGVYPLFRSGASDLFGACVHVQASLNLCSEVSSDLELDPEQHASSDESVDAATLVEDVDSSTMISSQDHTDIKPSHHITKEQLPVTEPGDDTFTAHVIIEQALHLATVPGVNGERSMPNVYVSYQTHPSLPPSCTSVAISSTKPSWKFQKLERISYTSLQSQGLVFKLWHTAHDKESTDERPDSSSEDRVIGFVLFDLTPLLAGMRQLIGWYNVTDFNGDCKGQIKLGVSPVSPVSPPRSLTASRAGHLLSQMQDGPSLDTSLAFNPGNAHKMFHQDNSQGKLHKDKATCCHLSGQQGDLLTDVKPPAGSEQPLHDLPVCSTSLLFSQLRQNMKELDTLQQNLNSILISCNVSDCASHLQKESLVVETPRHSFLNTNEASATSVKSLQTTNTGKAVMEGLGSEVKLPRTDFIESDITHEVVSVSGEPSGVTGDGHSLVSRMSPQERNLQKHGQCSYETSDKAMLAGRTETYNSQDIFPCHKGYRKEHPQHNMELDSFFSLEKNSKRSLVEYQQLSVDSELSSVSDISGEYSVSGCVQDNIQPTQFTDIKDSWLSSEDEETTTNASEVKQFERLSVPSSPIDNESDTVTLPNDAKESMFHSQEGDGDSGENDVDHDSGNHEEEHSVTGSQVVEVDLLIKSTEDCTTRAHLATGKTPSISSSRSHEKINGFERDQENEYNCVANSADVQFKEMPLSGYPMTTVTLPNFFMPSEQLAESMRALRLSSSYHNTSTSQSKLLARSNHLKTDQQTKGKLHEIFAKREPVHKARRDERPPISNSEADRIARIFNSGSV